MKSMRVDKFIKDHCPSVGEIYGYVPFPAGALPKVLAKKKEYKFSYTGADVAVVLEAIEAARNSSLASVRWIAKHIPEKHMVQPVGIALVLPKGQQIPGQGSLTL